jgi:hypothetical protein
MNISFHKSLEDTSDDELLNLLDDQGHVDDALVIRGVITPAVKKAHQEDLAAFSASLLTWED